MPGRFEQKDSHEFQVSLCCRDPVRKQTDRQTDKEEGQTPRRGGEEGGQGRGGAGRGKQRLRLASWRISFVEQKQAVPTEVPLSLGSINSVP